MPIAFPRAIPAALRIVGMSFRLAPMAELTPLRSGKQVAKDLGPSLWRARWQSTLHAPADGGAVRAWYDTLLSYEQFLGFHNLRQYPLAYANGWGNLQVGGNPFSGAGQLVGVGANNVEVSLDALPAGFVLSPGDFFAFDYADTRALHRVSAGAVANGSGQVAVEVRPHVRPGWAAAAAVAFYRASARMIVLPDTFEDQEEGRNVRFAFEAIQSL